MQWRGKNNFPKIYADVSDNASCGIPQLLHLCDASAGTDGLVWGLDAVASSSKFVHERLDGGGQPRRSLASIPVAVPK